MTNTPTPGDVTLLIDSARAGDEAASARLMELVYDELRRLASSYLRGEARGHTLQATALVHEAFLKLVRQPDGQFTGRTHFFAVAATAMRQILTDHARAKRAAKRGGSRPGSGHTPVPGDASAPGSREQWGRIGLDESASAPVAAGRAHGDAGVDVVALDDVLTKLASFDQRKHRIVELRFFGGLTVEQTADMMSLSISTVESEWRAARAWLNAQLAP